MANKTLFNSVSGLRPVADTHNNAGGAAYSLPAKHALAQMAATGCFADTYYTKAEDQLVAVRTLIGQVDDNTFLAKLAVYSRERAFMKDMPAALLVELSTRDRELTKKVFNRVVDNGRVLRNVFQMVRSGQFGRKGLSSSLRNLFQDWLNAATPGMLLSASIGNDPSLRDVLRMARPAPPNNERRALYGWLTDRPFEKWLPATAEDLPEQVKGLIAYRLAATAEEQVKILMGLSVRWDLLSDSAKSPLVWRAIAQKMGVQALRMNLNTLLRHEVIGDNGDPEITSYIAERLADATDIAASKQFPYQYLAAYLNADDAVPQSIKSALHKAAEIACGNIPVLPGPVLIGLDVSGSMSQAATGWREGHVSKMRCVDVAALFAVAILRRNPDSVLVPFDNRTHTASLDPGDTILSLAERLAKYGGGGTDCSLPLRAANTTFAKRSFAGVVMISDNASWIRLGSHGSTATMAEWSNFVTRQRGTKYANPKMACINIAPFGTAQAPESGGSIMNIGGFSDSVFSVVAEFFNNDPGRFVAEVEAIQL